MNPRNGSPPAAPDRLPPHSVEAEKAALGCMILDPVDALSHAIAKLGQEQVFYDLRHQQLYQTLVQMFDARETIDLVTITSWLQLTGSLDELGGLTYISTLPDAAPSAASIDSYLDILLDRYRARKLIRICTDTAGQVWEHEGDTPDLVNKASQELFELASGQITVEEEPISETVQKAMGIIETSAANQGAVSGLATGFADLDHMTTGFHAGELIVIAGRPSLGKTSLAMNIAEHVAIENHLPVGVFSLEMTRESLVLRMISCRARVPLRNMLDGYVAESGYPRIVNAAGQINHAPIFINDTPGLSILGLRTRAVRMHRQHGIKLLMVDYLQLMRGERRGNASRQEEVASISCGLKNLGKELEIPVIAVCQLNRQSVQEKNRKPRLDDLRESGAIEQDADLAGLLYVPKFEPGEDGDNYQQDGSCAAVNLYIAKQRNGPTGDVHLTFLKSLFRFESAAKVEQSDVPPEAQQQQPEMNL